MPTQNEERGEGRERQTRRPGWPGSLHACLKTNLLRFLPFKDIWWERFSTNIRHWIFFNSKVVLFKSLRCCGWCSLISIVAHLGRNRNDRGVRTTAAATAAHERKRALARWAGQERFARATKSKIPPNTTGLVCSTLHISTQIRKARLNTVPDLPHAAWR